MAARLLALLVAVAMVVGAVAYRQSREEAGGGNGGGGGDGRRALVVCARELGEEVCDAAGATRIEPVAETADRLVGARAAGIDAWITPGPWGAMVDSAGTSRLFGPSPAVAHSPLVAVVRKGTQPGGCPQPLTWRCIGDAAQEREFRLAADSPAHPVGLSVRAAALAGFLGTPDYSRAEITDGDGATWLANVDARLDAARDFQAVPLERFLAAQGAAAAYLTTAAAARAASQSAAFDVTALEPAAAVAVVVSSASPRGRRAVDRGDLTDALVERGWQRGAAPGGGGLPEPGVLLALRDFLG